MTRIDHPMPKGKTTWNADGRMVARILMLCASAAALLHGSMAAAAWINISPARGQASLCITTTTTGNCNTAPPTVTFNVPAAQLGSGTAIAGTAQVQYEMSVRKTRFGPNLTATMIYTAPATLVSGGGNSIPISDISWTSAAIAGAPGGTTLIPNGSFVAGSHNILSITSTGGRTYAGGILTFRFANTQVYAQGTYPATVNYTVSLQ